MDPKFLLARMLSGRGFWIALCVSCGALYSTWRSRARKTSLRKLMLVRSHTETEPPSGPLGFAVIRRQLEAQLGFDLTHLHAGDRVGELLNWAESRELVERLEELYQAPLPDVQTVRGYTLAELSHSLRKAPPRNASRAP